MSTPFRLRMAFFGLLVVYLSCLYLYVTYQSTIRETETYISPLECRDEVDMGVLERINASRRVFCALKHNQITTFSYFHPEYLLDKPKKKGGKPTEFKAAVFESIQLDLNKIPIAHQIESAKDDGYQHDPRFIFEPHHLQCTCSEFKHQVDVFNQFPTRRQSFSCDPKRRFAKASTNFHRNIIAISRKDDHNPFFQIANGLNAWIMMQTLNWSLADTQILLFDAGFPTPTEHFLQHVLSDHPLIYGKTLQDKYVSFDKLLIAPFETTGPLMSRLNSDLQPCRNSVLLESFKTHVLDRYDLNVDLRVRGRKTITVISRRNYQGRKLGRLWLNEDQVLNRMRQMWPEIQIRSIDFTLLTMVEQIKYMRETDIVIGMHGAGMVNVLWLPTNSFVVEIFPRKKKRSGFRNICFYTGCHHEEYRDGQDHGRKISRQHKTIDPDEWIVFLREKLIFND